MAKICRVIQIKLNQFYSLRKYPYDHRLTNKAYLSAITVTNISQSFTYKMAAKIMSVSPYVYLRVLGNWLKPT